MSQPTDYQYRTYGNEGSLKGGPRQMVNGQASVTHHNGMQSTNYNFTGTPSSQSSRDPSRETSRDPSPTPYLYNQYRSPLPRPPMPPPINGQQNTMNPVMPLPARLPPTQQYPPMYNVQNQFQVPVTQQQQPPPRDELANPQVEPPKPPISGFDQNLSLNSAAETKPYNVDNQDNVVQGIQPYSQEQNQFPNPMQPPRGQPIYQQNFGGQRMYAKNAHGMQHAAAAAAVPNPMSYGVVGSGPQLQAKPSSTSTVGYPGQQRTYPIQPPNPMNMQPDPLNKRYPEPYPDQMNQLNSQMNMMSVSQAGYNKLWGMETIDLLQCRNVLPPEKVEPPKIKLHREFLDSVNCSPDIFRCTLTKIPESNGLLQKSRLPLGVLIHPFKDLNHLPVIQCSTIVRCRACRTYINPFVYFNDSKRWKCCLCYRINELPEEFQFDPLTNTYGDPSRRPEVKTSTIEFIAPSEYMLRPPQPAVYLFVLDVSRLAVESGYLNVVCNAISEELSRLPGDGRTQIGFLAVDSAIHFFSIPDNVSQPQEMIMLDIDDVFLPCPENLIVNLKEREELVRDLLAQLPTKFQGTHDTNSALGAALQAAYKLMSPTGGRVTVFQTCLPNVGPGLLQAREDPNSRASKDVPHLNPVTDFYKRLALDCSGQQIAVDLFLLNSQYCDLATLSGMCKFSGGCIYHLPLFRGSKPQNAETLDRILRRYLARKIGFEAVMRVRCTRGLSIHTFHGNFFVRSTDLLSLPNVNPDAGFGMQISIEENLSDVQNVCFQAALLYTSSKGERRIRVHTLCLPVASNLADVLHSADQQCIVGLLSKMAVDRSQQSSLSDARDALINVAIDVLSAYKLTQPAMSGGLLVPGSLKLLPLYIISLLKCIAFRSGMSTRLDDRVFAMCQLKTLPLFQLVQIIYPDLYPVHALEDRNTKEVDGKLCPQPPRLHLSAEKIHSRGAFLMDAGDRIFILIGKNIHPTFCCNVLGVTAFASIPEEFYELPEIDTLDSERLRNFVFSLQEEKPYPVSVQIIRDDSHFRTLFIERLVEDRFESALSYHEFVQHLKTQVK
ncbi:protein transport protein Sec24AB isoform X2 [Nomia melanderi]|uniref:protein transport protein Sec24AB isoform X2 n=1 Tax=Nomia melanderi TaxID=2448451 RepID=UPI0013047397|nr:protein transport protein Sec24B isoform X2 [Nomia melanderi]